MELGNLDCGCDSRREVMGAGNWVNDIVWFAGGLFLTLLVWWGFR